MIPPLVSCYFVLEIDAGSVDSRRSDLCVGKVKRRPFVKRNRRAGIARGHLRMSPPPSALQSQHPCLYPTLPASPLIRWQTFQTVHRRYLNKRLETFLCSGRARQ